MQKYLVLALIVSVLTACASSSTPSAIPDPYPGSGGLYFGTPSSADVASGRSVWSKGKADFAKIGTTTKAEVVKALGAPAWWSTDKDGSSSLGYDFVEQNSFMGMQRVVRATFTFDQQLRLSSTKLPNQAP